MRWVIGLVVVAVLVILGYQYTNQPRPLSSKTSEQQSLWEEVGPATYRMRVPNGWLYLRYGSKETTFVPEK